MSETNVSVRFSVTDAETVREALEKLGTDGQRALDKLNAAGQAPAAGLKAVSSIVEDLKSRATGLAFSLGPVGTGLVQLGPIGLAAGAALGLVAAVIGHVIDEANRLGSVSQSLRNLSETTGLAGTALQGLVNAGGQLGIESEKIESSLSRFTSQLDQMHQATGPLYDQIVKVNPAIADQMVKTRDAATAWNLLAQAYTAADTAQRAAIARAAFGRGGIGTGRLLEATAGAGGLDALSAQNSNVLTDAQIKKFAELTSKIAETNKTAKDLMASLWTEDVLERELQAAQRFERIAKAAKEIHDADPGTTAWGRFWESVGRALSGDVATLNRQDSGTKISVGQAPSVWGGEGGSGAFTPQPADKETAEAALNKMRAWMSILGPAATSTEQLNLRQAELNAAVEKAGGKYGDLASRAKTYYDVQQSGSDLQIRVQNNVASADELRVQRARELQLLVSQEKLTQDQATRSLQSYEKVIEQTIEQERTRGAALTGLMNLENQAGSLRNQLDTLGVDSLNNLNTGLLDMETGAKRGKDAVINLEQQFGRSLLNMMNQMIIMKPIAQGLQSVLGSFLPNFSASKPGTSPVDEGGFEAAFPSANGNAFSGGSVIPFRVGGIVRRPTLFAMANGGTGLAGEAGEEGILPLTRIGGKLGVHAVGGGTNVEVNVNVVNQTDSNVSVEQKKNDNGTVDINLMIRSAVGQQISRGDHNKALAGQGFTRRVGQLR